MQFLILCIYKLPFQGAVLVARDPPVGVEAQALSLMASAVLSHDQEFSNCDAIAYGLSRDIVGIYEKPLHLILDAIFYYPSPMSDLHVPFQDGSSYGSMLWPHGEEEHAHTNRPNSSDDGEQHQSYNGGSNWLCEYGSSIYGTWGEGFLSRGWGTDDEGYGGGIEEPENPYQGGGRYDSYHYKELERLPAYDDYYCHWSWFGCGAEENLYESNWEDPKLAQGFQDELGIYQGIFGYWPSFFQKDNKNYDQEVNYGN